MASASDVRAGGQSGSEWAISLYTDAVLATSSLLSPSFSPIDACSWLLHTTQQPHSHYRIRRPETLRTVIARSLDSVDLVSVYLHTAHHGGQKVGQGASR